MKLGFIGKALVLGSFCVIASSTRAQALDFNFFFNDGGGLGTVSGIIKNVNATGSSLTSASYAEILSSPNNNLLGTYEYDYHDTFTVSNNQITNAQFVIFRNNLPSGGYYELLLNWGSQNGIWGSAPSDSDPYMGYYSNVNGFNGVTYTAAAAEVPFDFDPAFGAALGLPLFIGLRHLKKRVASKKLKFNPTGTIS